MPYNTFDPYQANRLWSPYLSPGLGTGNPLLDIAGSLIAGQGIFPQPQGTNSVMDMMMLRSRNLDQHYIIKRALASSQLAARMGGINVDSPFYQALYPFAAVPDSPLWPLMSPLIGGNPVRAQKGLYADLNGQTLASLGRLGSASAFETDRMMDQLQGRFYRRADFGRYVESVAAPLRRAFGDAGFERLNNNWTLDTVRGLEGVGATRVNRDMGNLLESAVTRIQRVREDTGMSDLDKTTAITKIQEEAKAAAQSFLSSISNREAQQKMGKSFADALQSSDAKQALRDFHQEWKGEMQDAFRMAERGVEFRSGKVPGGIDYRFTRGFNIEDITGSFGRAASAGLVGRNTGLNITGYAASSLSALDAARGLFGRDLSGRELTEEINRLIGIGSVNMADEGDARKLEEMLRNVKAMARVAGVSIESMRGVIDEAKQIAARNPELPLGIGGFTAAQIATQAMSDTTAALSYMDPKMIRALGGPVGLTSGRVAGMTAGMGEQTSRILAALHYHAVQVGGQGSAAAQAIRNFAQNGDTTGIGLNTFIQKIAPSLNMSPQQALNFAQTNPLLSNLGLEQSPEIGRAGGNAMRITLMREWDALTGGTAGFGEELTRVSLDPKYGTMSDEQIAADVQSRLARPLTVSQRKQLSAVAARARQKNANGEGLMNITDIMATAGLADFRGTAQQFVSVGGDVVLAKNYNPQARAAHQRLESIRRSSAKLEAAHAANLAEINTPILQRTFQSFIEGRGADGGVAELRRLFSGGSVVADYMAGVGNLADAERMYRALPEGRLDAAGNWVAGGSNEELIKVMRTLYPSMDLANLARTSDIVDRKDLQRIGAIYNGVQSITKTLLSGGITTYGELEEYLGKQVGVPAAIAELAGLKKSPANSRISSSELAAIAKRIASGANEKDVAAIIGKYAGKGISAEAIRSAGRDYGMFDPEGHFSGDFNLRNLVGFSIENARFMARTGEARNEGSRLVTEIEALSSEDDISNFNALQRMYAGQIDFSDSGVGRYTAKINADVLMGIADADPANAVSLATSALSQAGMSKSEVPALIEAARKLRKFDSQRLLSGSKLITRNDLYSAARASKAAQAQTAFLSPYYRESGENTWRQLIASSDASGTAIARFNRIKKELMGGQGNFSVFAEELKKNPELARRKDAILMEGASEAEGSRNKELFDKYFSQYEESKRMIDAGQTEGKSANPLAALDIKGIIAAITALTSAFNSAVKNP